MRHAHGMQHCLDLSSPEIEVVAQDRETWGYIVLLQNELLQKTGMIGHEIMDFDSRKTVAFQLHPEIAIRFDPIGHIPPSDKAGMLQRSGRKMTQL
jgi:hypothetical protein